MRKSFVLTIDIELSDQEALLAVARKWAEEQGCNPLEMVPDASAALVSIVTGSDISPLDAGYEIMRENCEERA